MAANLKLASYQGLNPVIHEKTRLAIMTFLISAGEPSFTELKAELQLTDGNLNLHMRVLEKNGFVKVHKAFVERRPRTTYQVTDKGIRAFEEHVALLERILRFSRRGRAEKHAEK